MSSYGLMEFAELTGRTDDDEVRALLAFALGSPSRASVSAAADAYSGASDRFLYGFVDNGELVGLIGGTLEGAAALILHIAVRPVRRLTGIGRRLIQELRQRLEIQELRAETDRDAIDFYERLGFSVQTLGEVYPGVERFRCRWLAV